MNRAFLLCVPLLTGGSLPDTPPAPLPYEVNTHQLLTSLAFLTSRGFATVINGTAGTPGGHMLVKLGDSTYDPIVDLIESSPDDAYYWDYMLGHVGAGVSGSLLRRLGDNAMLRALTWTSLGAVFEDFYTLDWWNECNRMVRSRPLHHFFDEFHGGAPLTISAGYWADLLGQNLLGCTENARPVNAQRWGTIEPTNTQRFELALPLYREALAAPTADDRRVAWFKLLRVLGQTAHLLQDMCQPSHTRDDPHPERDPSALETWCAEHVLPAPATGGNLLGITLRPEDLALFVRMLTTLNPAAQNFYAPDVRDYFTEAARFSGRSFYSDSTIDAERANPTFERVDAGRGWGRRRSTAAANRGALLCLETIEVDFLTMRPRVVQTLDDPAVLRSNAEHLLPKALEVSQSFFDNFFRGAIEVEPLDDHSSGRIRIRNASDPTILRSRAAESDLLAMRAGGTVSLYYYAADWELMPLFPPVALTGDLAIQTTEDLELNPAVKLERLRDGTESGAAPVSDTILVVYEGLIGPEPGIAFAHYEAEYVEPQIQATVSPNLLRNAGDEFDVTIRASGCVDYPLRVEIDFDWWTANGVDLEFFRDGRVQTERHALSIGPIRANQQFEYDPSQRYVVPLRIPSVLYEPPTNPFYTRAQAYARMALVSPYRFAFGSGGGPSFPALLEVTENAGPNRVRLDQTLATRRLWENSVRWFITMLPL